MPFQLGDTFPNFDAEAYGVDGFNLYNYLGNCWGLFFSHPSDFTPVCTTELGEAAKLSSTFKEKNCKLVAFSCNDLQSHKEWAKDIMTLSGQSGELPFPIVCDPQRTLGTKLGIMDPSEKDHSGLPMTCRCVFFISPTKKVMSMILYPATLGRSFKEIMRVLDALQLTAEYPVSTPVEWTPGSKCCIPHFLSDDEAKQKFPKGVERKELPSGKGYLRYTPDPRS